MKLSRSIAISAMAATILLATLVQAESPNTTPAAELIDYNDKYNKIAGDYNIDAFLSLYNSSPLWIAPNEAPVPGLDIPRATFEFFAGNGGSLHHSADHSFVSQDGTLAVLIGRYDLDVEKVGVKGSGTYLFVMKKTDDEWDIVVDMYNQHTPEN